VLDEYIRSDEETTGRTLVGRDGLADLIRLAKQRPKPFDCIIIDDTSRLGRYLPDVLRECDRLMHNGVFLYFASDRLDSRDDSFRIMHIFKGYRDEDFIRDLGHKIHRGQEGRVLDGYVAGNRCYGYKNVPIPDGNGKSSFGRPALIGVKQELVSEEAEVVKRIMEMRADGLSFGRIAQILKEEGVTPPRNPNTAVMPAWYASTIKQITHNELYRGWRVWNRTQNVFNQAEGKKSKRNRPESEWIRVEVPELRIISDELWEKVQAVNRRGRDKYYATRQGGMNRTEHSRKYLFSGVMVCGICGGPYTVINGKAPNVRYGCPNRAFRHTCTNQTTILRTRLERQLIAALSANLLDDRLEEDRTGGFAAQLKTRIELEEQLAHEAELDRPTLEKERTELSAQGRRLSEAIAMHDSPFLVEQLKNVDSRMAEIDIRLRSRTAAKLPNFTDEQIREFLRKESTNFCEVLAGDPEVAKREIQKRIKRLVLTPKQTPNGTVLEVTGDVELFQQLGGLMLNNSLDGIAQHYTFPRIVITVVLDPSLPVAA
jgi:DNA invertase Pin-like site-specific DNA recombinase